MPHPTNQALQSNVNRLPLSLLQWITLWGFHLYSFLTLLISAWTVKNIIDEGAFIVGGDFFLTHHRADAYYNSHPPISQILSGLIPHLLGQPIGEWFSQLNMFESRLPHILLFCLGGIVITRLLLKRLGFLPALVFTLLYTLSPPFKAYAALSITDSDPAVLVGIAATWLWAICFDRQKSDQSPKTSLFFGIFFVAGLAATCKITSVLFIPFFLAVHLFYEFNFVSFLSDTSLLRKRLCHLLTLKEPKSTYFRAFLIPTLGVFLAFLIAYQFRINDFKLFRDSINYSLSHREGGHLTSLMGQIRTHGFWYYYTVVFLFKTPVPALILFALALRKYFKRSNALTFFLFFFPALCMFIILSRNSVQLGLRYIEPTLILWTILTAIAFGSIPTSFFRQSLVFLSAIVLLTSDAYSLAQEGYLSYFNILAPRPTTRYFADCNNDWGQGVPSYLLSKTAGSGPAGSFVDFMATVSSKTMRFYMGATEINGLWGSPVAPLLRTFPPKETIGGYELVEVGKLDLFEALLENQPINSVQGFSLLPYDYRGHLGKMPRLQCAAGQTAGVQTVDLLRTPLKVKTDTEKEEKALLIEKINQGQLVEKEGKSIRLDITLPLKNKETYLIFASTNAKLELAAGGTSWITIPNGGPIPREAHWRDLRGEENPIDVRLQYSLPDGLKWNQTYVKLYLANLECQPITP